MKKIPLHLVTQYGSKLNRNGISAGHQTHFEMSMVVHQPKVSEVHFSLVKLSTFTMPGNIRRVSFTVLFRV
jgi:hypothetical protein